MGVHNNIKRILLTITGLTLMTIFSWLYNLEDAQPPVSPIQQRGISHGKNQQKKGIPNDIALGNFTHLDVNSTGKSPQTEPVDDGLPVWRFRAKNSHRRPFETLPYPPLEKRQTYSTNPAANDPKPRIIMYGSELWGSKSWGKPLGKELFKKCTFSNCRAEYDRKYLPQADVLLFYQVDNKWTTPLVRQPHHIYAVITGESPSECSLKPYDYITNLTISSRLDSDIVLNYVFRRKLHITPGGKFKPKIPFRNKSSNVSWIVSHCKTSSKRELYAKALSKYIDVDIYGGCGPFKCKKQRKPPNNECFLQLEQKYKFYLSFENSICKDYATEKLTNPLRHDLVPVVLGGGNYTHIAPPNSFIDAADFQTPKDLADYLHYLAENEAEYMKYLQWKHEYDYFNRHDVMCDLCEIATERTFQRTAETWNMAKWWEHNACDNGLVERMLSNFTSQM